MRAPSLVLSATLALTLLVSGRFSFGNPESSLLSNCAATLEQITGTKIEVRASPPVSIEHSLPVVCRALDGAFREAASNPEIRQEFSRIVHIVNIESPLLSDGLHHVALKNEVLSIQTFPDADAEPTLRKLIVEVLLKVARLDERDRRRVQP